MSTTIFYDQKLSDISAQEFLTSINFNRGKDCAGPVLQIVNSEIQKSGNKLLFNNSKSSDLLTKP